MANTASPTVVLLPKFGNSVESSIIVRWLKQVGDAIVEGETLCEVETDKATMEVPSPATGILLEQRAAVGDDVLVQTPIAVVGVVSTPSTLPTLPTPSTLSAPISPRARTLATRTGVDTRRLVGSGPAGRIIERDVQAALQAQPKLTPLARSMLAKGDFVVPPAGSGPGGRVLRRDLVGAVNPTLDVHDSESTPTSPAPEGPSQFSQETSIHTRALVGVRRVIAQRMLASLQTTAQLTLNRSADARQLQALRKRFKESPEALGMRKVTLNDLVMFAVARALVQHPALNALFRDDTISEYAVIHLGMAVDTPRGLLVPVIREAERLSLRALSSEARRLADACQQGMAKPDELSGGTFTISNLGNLGIESFTPILNTPQVAILGVGGINLKPVETVDGVAFIPHIQLSLTVNHQVIDGAPAARFLQQLAEYLANLDVVLAL